MTRAWGAVYAVAAQNGAPWTRYTTRKEVEEGGASALALVEKRMDAAMIEGTRKGVERGMAFADAEKIAYEGKAPEVEGKAVLRYTSRSGRVRVSATPSRAILTVRRDAGDGVPYVVASCLITYTEEGEMRVGEVGTTPMCEARHEEAMARMIRACVG